ncbi:LamG domain-containing protein [Devosia aurantiaca]|uniref:LamG domain-containing protein n=1 Tax=Devosia aurantiaca TaxID=2714858 RepID=A0A6M1SP79_9HYPH|nr:LamG domain-containing protein [Devosia aurantiaca]NGP18930.1 LamG domain-containing protein [Devosia aurantiaca]
MISPVGLLAYYPLDADASDAYGTFPGTPTSVSFVPGKIRGAASFNGSSSKIAVPIQSAMATNFSLAAWINFAATGTLFLNGTQSGRSRFAILSDGRLRFTEDNIADYTFTPVLAFNTWYHIVFVKNGNSGANLTLYVNGVASGSVSVGTITTPSGTAYIGANNTTTFWSGLLDDISLWSRVLTADEIAKLASGTAGIATR